jgi:hypothetical protein
MSRTATPAPLTDRQMWRRALSRVHPDVGGDRATFVWLTAVRESVEDGLCPECSFRYRMSSSDKGRARRDTEGREDDVERIGFDPGVDHAERTLCSLRWYRNAAEPWRSVLMTLADYPEAEHGRRYAEQQKGASWRSLAAIAHVGCGHVLRRPSGVLQRS